MYLYRVTVRLLYQHSRVTVHVSSGTPVGQIIQKMWDEEKEHLDTMERLAAKNDVPTTVLAPVFSVAAYALGRLLWFCSFASFLETLRILFSLSLSLS